MDSHLCSISINIFISNFFIDILRKINLSTLNHKKYCKIIRNLFITDATNYINTKSITWTSNYNTIYELSPCKEVVFKASKDL